MASTDTTKAPPRKRYDITGVDAKFSKAMAEAFGKYAKYREVQRRALNASVRKSVDEHTLL